MLLGRWSVRGQLVHQHLYLSNIGTFVSIKYQLNAGDDLYLIVENLRLYLESEEIQLASNGGYSLPDGSEESQTPLFLGRRFAEGGDRDRMFISGGSGYTMNKATLKTLVVDGFPNCFPHMKTFSEDVMVATCLRKVCTIECCAIQLTM